MSAGLIRLGKGGMKTSEPRVKCARPASEMDIEQVMEVDWDKLEGEELRHLFVEGKVHLIPAEKAWRRLALKMVIVADHTQKMQAVDRATHSAAKIPEKDLEDGPCVHPLFARYSGGNRYGRYVHCRMCRQRLSFLKNATPAVGKTQKGGDTSLKAEEAPYDVPKNKAVAKPKGRPRKEVTEIKESEEEQKAAASSTGTTSAQEIGEAVAQHLTPTLNVLIEAIAALRLQQAATVAKMEAADC